MPMRCVARLPCPAASWRRAAGHPGRSRLDARRRSRAINPAGDRFRSAHRSGPGPHHPCGLRFSRGYLTEAPARSSKRRPGNRRLGWERLVAASGIELEAKRGWVPPPPVFPRPERGRGNLARSTPGPAQDLRPLETTSPTQMDSKGQAFGGVQRQSLWPCLPSRSRSRPIDTTRTQAGTAPCRLADRRLKKRHPSRTAR